MSALWESLASADELTVVTHGRTSGREHRVQVWFAVDGEDLWLRTDRDADWYRNLRRERRCVIVAGAERAVAELMPITDEAAALRRIVELWRAKYGAEWVGDWYVERGRVPVRLRVVEERRLGDGSGGA